jgi:5,5'-dehydrodivanillate O-demethylase
MIKRRVVEGNTEDDDPWRVGHPVIFPYILRVGSRGQFTFQIRVPVDDTHTWHVYYSAYRPGIPVPKQDSIPIYEAPLYDRDGKFEMEVTTVQDFFAWITQGAVAERDKEHLGQSDIGVIMFRDLLFDQMEKVERGEDPIEVYRDPAKNVCIDLPQEQLAYDTRQGRKWGEWFEGTRLKRGADRSSPLITTLRDLFLGGDRRTERGEPLLPPIVPTAYPEAPGHREVVLLP